MKFTSIISSIISTIPVPFLGIRSTEVLSVASKVTLISASQEEIALFGLQDSFV